MTREVSADVIIVNMVVLVDVPSAHSADPPPNFGVIRNLDHEQFNSEGRRVKNCRSYTSRGIYNREHRYRYMSDEEADNKEMDMVHFERWGSFGEVTDKMVAPLRDAIPQNTYYVSCSASPSGSSSMRS